MTIKNSLPVAWIFLCCYPDRRDQISSIATALCEFPLVDCGNPSVAQRGKFQGKHGNEGVHNAVTRILDPLLLRAQRGFLHNTAPNCPSPEFHILMEMPAVGGRIDETVFV
jgi:hypothetical protein